MHDNSGLIQFVRYYIITLLPNSFVRFVPEASKIWTFSDDTIYLNSSPQNPALMTIYDV